MSQDKNDKSITLFLAQNNFILQWLWRLGVIAVAIIVWYYNIETKTHAADVYLSKTDAKSEYVCKETAEKIYVKTDVHAEKEKREDERWNEIKETLKELKRRIPNK
jgi:hypothetical protein